MKFLGDLKQIEGSIYQVGLIHNMPFDEVNGLGKTAEELSAIGVLVETVPESNPQEGYQTAGIFVDKSDNRVWWEYEPIPVDEVEQQITDIQLALVEIYEGMMTNG
jgi:hypothetical protein